MGWYPFGSLGLVVTKVYLQRVWSISPKIYVGLNHQLTHSNTHIRLVYFESSVAPPTFLNQCIFLTAFFIRQCFSFVCRYCLQHTNFAHSLHYLIIFGTCSDCVHRYCAQRKSVMSKILLVKYWLQENIY